ncbi:unnamed protein product [Symbiodinium microadriaticum]|nr:unnamed protein product [Symbiodinium microadriaticum]
MSGWSPAAPRPFSPAAAGAAAASGASGASAMGSWRFGPEVRHVEAPASEKVNQLRRSFTSLQAEMQLSFQRQDGEVASEPFGAFLPNSGREGVLAPVAGGSMALGSSSSLASTVPGGAADVSPSNAKSETGELDVWLKEKAQKIKVMRDSCGRVVEPELGHAFDNAGSTMSFLLLKANCMLFSEGP